MGQGAPDPALDFLGPQLAGLCITCYPQDDELTLYRYDTIVQNYGWDFMDRLMANRPQFIRGHLGVAQEIMGNRAGVSFDATLFTTVGPQASGANIAVVIPETPGCRSGPPVGHLPRGRRTRTLRSST